ncbi:MAG: diguanylate cyclase [Myxococcales bacterium]
MSEKHRILIAEANRAVGGVLRKYLEGAGFAAETVESFDDALQRLRAWGPDLLICGVIGLDGQALCRKAKEAAPALPVVLIYPPDDDDPDARANAAGADSLMIGPIKRGNVLATVRTLLRVRELTLQLQDAQQELERRITAPSAKGNDQQVDFEFFKRLLLMEVKRSRRYRYPLSFLMVALDDFQGTVGRLDPRAQGRFMGSVLGLAVKSVRDIDLCVLYAQDKFLIFLPHTDQPGAFHVAGRLRERIEDFAEGPKITASIGIASYDGSGSTVSFGGLLKDATAALKKAQTEGGNRIEAGERQKPRARVSIG